MVVQISATRRKELAVLKRVSYRGKISLFGVCQLKNTITGGQILNLLTRRSNALEGITFQIFFQLNSGSLFIVEHQLHWTFPTLQKFYLFV